jgi:hypothetical protein
MMRRIEISSLAENMRMKLDYEVFDHSSKFLTVSRKSSQLEAVLWSSLGCFREYFCSHFSVHRATGCDISCDTMPLPRMANSQFQRKTIV